MTNAEVIVIGAGFAGATAARDSAEAGHDVLVLEARDRLGGRTWYRQYEGKEQKVEIGGTWIAPSVQKFVAAEIERYGAEVFQSPQYARYGWGIGGEMDRRPFPFTPEEWAPLERAVAKLDTDAERIRFYEEPLGQPHVAEFDIPYSDYIAAMDLPQRVADFLLAWPTFYYGAYPEKLSALHVLAWHNSFGSAVGWFLLLVDKYVGGTGVMLEKILHDQQIGVRHEVDIVSIADHGDHVTLTSADGETFEAKHVINTAPINTWERITFDPPLPPAHEGMAQEKQAGESVKVWALVPPQEGHFFGAGMHTVFKWIASEYTTDEGTYLCCFASAEADLDGDDLGAVERAVQEFLPDTPVLAVDWHDWNNDPYSNGTWMAYKPGQIMKYSVDIQQPHGNVYFANSDLALGWAGWIDGAIESGGRAAKQSNEAFGSTQ